MSIVNYPFGVGMSGKDVVEVKATCKCCRMQFGYKTPRTAQITRERCEGCVGHRPDGNPAQRLTMLEDHESRGLERIRWATEKARELAEERDRALEQDKISRRASYGSHKRREQAEKRLHAILAIHTDGETDGTCGCGHAMPCPTMSALDEFDRDNPDDFYFGYVYEAPRPRPVARPASGPSTHIRPTS